MKEPEKPSRYPFLTIDPDLDRLDLNNFRTEKLERSIRNSKVYGVPPLNRSEESL